MVSGSYQKGNFSWFGLWGFLQVCFFQRLLESIGSFEGIKKKEHSIAVAPVVGVSDAYISSARYF